ncbi:MULTISPECIES: helix-turn-helix transcriptional regulator [unclassified Oceanobacillus]|uniref:helix-turn-helix domain-containing protein n=1 Tax=unclassified Oceanobacillus TaxID=2630292 RepID=UPI001BE5C896|nr:MULTISPECIES: helix-turn-helix transcriptional regulator [unclassified Oceanobacillus]MBT2600926.1 helix-turn-helix transcriptional regulator [Oceanobacillus sp. ISL-74]MBT2653623.1 helix-turn-helix transcriptional regulator [Oceanobacillus sp. ISL-73]
MLKSRIAEVIDSKGLKHKWVAEQLNMNPTILSRWIHNRGKPSVDKLFQLAYVLNCKVDDLYTYEDDNEE